MLFWNCCEGSAKLDTEIEHIYPKSVHNNIVQEYDANRHDIKRKINKKAQTSRENLRTIFNDITRSDPAGILVSFRECGSSMFRARKLLQPNIPKSAQEFCVQLPTANFAANLKATIILGNRIAVILSPTNYTK